MGLANRANPHIEKAVNSQVAKLERQESVLDARRRGQSFREIARQQKRDVKAVHRDFQQAMNRLSPIENIEEYRRLTMERLEGILEDAMCNMELAEDFKEWHANVDVSLKTIDRLIKVTGLDKHEPESAQQIDVTVRFDDIEHSMKTLARHGVIDVTEYVPQPEEEEEGDSTHGDPFGPALPSGHDSSE